MVVPPATCHGPPHRMAHVRACVAVRRPGRAPCLVGAARWATHFNSFIWNTNRYPNASALVEAVHAQGARITFWLTRSVALRARASAPGPARPGPLAC